MKRPLQALKSSWYVWLFPAIALAISAWLLSDYLRQKGTLVTVRFDDASGIQIEKTAVRFRGIPIGIVKDLYLSEDRKDVVAEILLRKSAAEFAVEGTKFSLVVPKVSLQGISGLDTLLEGTYISALPGKLDGAEKTDFKAAANSASTDTLDDTSAYFVDTTSVESVTSHDAVTYRGLRIGSVTKLILAKGGQSVRLQLNIENRYVHLIRTNTVFWRKIGIDAKLGLFHSEIKVNSMDSIMNGGIEMATPSEAGPTAKGHQKFMLATAAPKDYEKWSPQLE